MGWRCCRGVHCWGLKGRTTSAVKHFTKAKVSTVSVEQYGSYEHFIYYTVSVTSMSTQTYS